MKELKKPGRSAEANKVKLYWWENLIYCDDQCGSPVTICIPNFTCHNGTCSDGNCTANCTQGCGGIC